MAKKKKEAEQATPAAAKRQTTIAGYVDHAFENRPWYARTADCVKAGTVKFYTGFLDLDLNLYGGFPYGKLSMASGADSGGKSTLMIRTVARMLRTCRLCYTPIVDFMNYATGETRTACRCGKTKPMNGIYIDGEDRLDMVWGAKHGLPVSKDDPLVEHLVVLKPSTGEMVTDAVRRMIQDDILDFAVVDSFASLYPESNEGRTAGQMMPGASAKMVQTFLTAVLYENLKGGNNKRRCTVLGTQQLRANIGQMYGPQTTIPGGWFLKHGLTTHIALKRPRINEGIDKKKMTVENATHYADFECEVVKASLGGNERSHAHWRLYTRKYGNHATADSDEAKRVIEALAVFKMAGKSSAGGYDLLGINFPTIEAMTAAVAQNETFGLVARYVLLYNKLPEDSRAYLDIDRFNYDPFYELVQEEANGTETQLVRFRLVERGATPGANRQRTKPARKDSIADKELAKLAPPDTAAVAG